MRDAAKQILRKLAVLKGPHDQQFGPDLLRGLVDGSGNPAAVALHMHADGMDAVTFQ